MLDRIRERYPIVMHGVSLSIGSTAPLDMDYLGALKGARRARQAEVDLRSSVLDRRARREPARPPADPLHRRGAGPRRRSRQPVQDFLGRRLTLENVSSYVTFAQSEMTEWEFVQRARRARRLLAPVRRQQRLCQRLQSRLLRRRFPATACRATASCSSMWPATATRKPTSSTPTTIRCATRCGTSIARRSRYFGPVSTMIERDDNIPPLAELVDELDHARGDRRRGARHRRPTPASLRLAAAE